MAFSSLLVLNGLEFTDDGRTITADAEKREVEVELANGTIRKYRKAIKNKFSISYEWLPGTNAATSDGKLGRDLLKITTFLSDPCICQIRYRNSEYVTFVGYIENYSEELIRRDFISDTTFWNVKFDLREA